MHLKRLVLRVLRGSPHGELEGGFACLALLPPSSAPCSGLYNPVQVEDEKSLFCVLSSTWKLLEMVSQLGKAGTA